MAFADSRPSTTTRRIRALTTLLALASMVLSTIASALTPGVASAQANPCAPPANEIACENSKPGSPASVWDLGSVDSSQIEGFTTDISVNRGQTFHFKVNTTATAYRIEIYRIGYYGGLGARKIDEIANTAALKQTQPACVRGPNDSKGAATGLLDCGTWLESASWAVPANAVSGVYLAKLVREDAVAGVNHIPFVIRNDASSSDLLFQTSDTTWQAYNGYGGNSLYVNQAGDLPAGRAFKVSYNRPFATRNSFAQKDYLFNSEYPMIRWLEANGYDVTYQSGIDSDRLGNLIRNHRAFLSVGHDEYWSGSQRASVEAARDAGVHLAFFSGNEVFWKTRWEASVDGTETPYRTLVTYKETQANAKIDPSPEWTGTWRDPRFVTPRPENALSGTMFTVQGTHGEIKAPASEGKLRFWRNTGVANLLPGDKAELGKETVGFEWDEDIDNAFRPAGLMKLSSATYSVTQKLVDFGTTVAPGTATHSMTLYRHASGALVFSAGTIQYAWGLDSAHDRGPVPPTSDPRLQQATVNLLADMALQPQTLQAGLVAGTVSNDVTAPTSTITGPAAGTVVPTGSPVTINGTADDVGGVVGGVEVSADGGATWHPATYTRRATGTTVDWSYSWTPSTPGAATIKSRAVDDSANLEVASAGVGVTVQMRQCTPTAGCSIWHDGTTPQNASVNSSLPHEVGLRFRPATDGFITGVRFYKGAANTGTHVGRLWTNTGTKLAEATFTNETATGWQRATFATAVPVTANTTYVVSYFAPNGGYAFDSFYFDAAGVDNPPLRALKNGEDGLQGAFAGGSPGFAGAFPTQSFQATNYWVDAVFSSTPPPDTTPPTVTIQTPAPNATDAGLTRVAATFNEDVQPNVSFVVRDAASNAVPGAVSYSAATRTATFTPNPPLALGATYSASVSATDLANNTMSPVNWSFSTPACTLDARCQLWSDATTPAAAVTSSPGKIELGVRFQVDAPGFITGLRFHKQASNTPTPDPHIGRLWTNDGMMLASATFTNEAASGWQKVDFAQAVNVVPGVTYVASYISSTGNYSFNSAYFSQAEYQAGPLRALKDLGGIQGNGVFQPGSGFPTQSFNATNYWVDVVFSVASPGDTTPPTVANRSPAPNATRAPISKVTATFDERVQPSSVQLTLVGPTGSVSGSTSYDDPTRTATLQPIVPLRLGRHYTATVGATDLANNAMSPVSWSFDTPTCPCSVWDATAAPVNPSANDAAAIELGLRFRPTTDGRITGVRFYKGSTNTGTHVGRLWTNTGTKRAEATFTNETATGWQQVTFATPVDVTANTTYVVSYLAPNGGYAADLDYFATTGVEAGPLLALKDGVDGKQGSYVYGGGFPTQTFRSANYWVDAVFVEGGVGGQTDTTPPTVSDHSPATGADRAGITKVSATFDEAVDPSTIVFEVRDGANQLVPGTFAYDSATLTATLAPNPLLALPGSYTVKVQATDLASPTPNTMAPFTWSFRTPACPCSVWDGTATPLNASVNATAPNELGLRFKASINGRATGVRFYKGSLNTGTHVGRLWTNTGTKLAEVTFTNETATGWQEASFASPVDLVAGTTYVVSYLAPNGGYAYDFDYFTTGGREAGPLRALKHGEDGPQGSYATGPAGVFTGGFPSQSFRETNYWVDVVFSPAPPANVPPSALTLTQSAPAVDEGSTLTLNGSFTDPDTADTHTVVIDWGDGLPNTTLNLAAGALTFTAQHRYLDDSPPGLSDARSIGVRVTDPAGGEVLASASVTVNNVAPTATIDTPPGGSTSFFPEGTAISLTSTVTDPGVPDTHSYSWTVTKNGAGYAFGNTAGFTFTPDDNGTYVVSLTVTDDDGGATTTSVVRDVTNVAPTAAITGAPAGGVAEGTAITLGGTASDVGSADTAAGLTLAWSATKNGAAFASGTGTGFSFTPDDNGAYVVTLTATDKDGGAGTATATITVTNAAPTAAINGAPATSGEGTAIPLTGAATDPSAADTAAGFTFAWGVTKGGSPFASGAGSAFSFTPDDNGDYVVSLTATDKDGGASQVVSNTIKVINVFPTAIITGVPAPGTIGIGDPVHLGSQVTDPSPLDTAAGFIRAWRVTRDGNAFASGTASTVSFTPNAAGTYLIILTATDKDGGPGEDRETIIVANPVPVVTIQGAPTGPSPEGTRVSLTSTLSNWTQGASLTYDWIVTKNGAAFASSTCDQECGFSFTPNDNGTYVVTLTVTAAGTPGSDSKTITVANVAPTVAITGAPSTGTIGAAVALGSSVTDPSAADTAAGFTYAWGVTRDGAAFGSGTASSFSFTPNAAGTYVVTLTATDKDGGVSGSDSKTIAVAVALSVTIDGAPAGASPEGAAVALTSTVNGAAPGASIAYAWSVTKAGAAFGSGSANSFSFTPNDNGSYAVSLTVTVNGSSASTSQTIAVANVAPSGLTTGLDFTSIDEGDTVTLSGRFVDPGTADGHTLVIAWGDGSANTTLNLAAGVLTYSTTHKYLDDNPTASFSDLNTITVSVVDKDGGTVSGTTDIAVFNVPPVLGPITAPTGPIRINGSVTVSANFTDIGVLDTHTARIYWGDNTSSSGTVTEANGSGTVTGTHIYTTAGTYTVKITVTDDDTSSASSFYRYVVVYDPDGGWVAGTGDIDSPKGAYPADLTATGKAQFGFVSKYPTSGSTAPVGSTQFQVKLKHVKFEFFSSSYDWLVVSGPKATYTGTGTLSGAGGYGFLLSAIDGQAVGGGGTDKFRLKIWNKTTGAIIYDNQDADPVKAGHQLGAPDDANPTAVITSGVIQIFQQ